MWWISGEIQIAWGNSWATLRLISRIASRNYDFLCM